MPDAPLDAGSRPADPYPGTRLGDLTLLEASRILQRDRKLVLGLPAALALLVLLVTLLLPRAYSASASFAPQAASGSLGGLANLANQFGVTIPGTGESESPDFYADLLGSDQILRAVASASYAASVKGDTVRGDLASFYGIEEATPAETLEETVEELRDDLSISVGLKTGVVKFTVRARHPDLAQEIAERALESLNDFNLKSRQSQAGAQRAFIGGQVEEAAAELKQAEDRLQGFLQRNRDYRGSPQLAFEHDRLQRQVDLRHQVYMTLVQGFEQAKIDEVRNTPVITIVEQPVVPAQPDSRYLVLKLFLVLVVGTLMAVAISLVREFARR